MRSCKLILILFIGILLVACTKDGEQNPNPPIGKIRGKLVFEAFDFYDYDIGNSKDDLKVLDAIGTYTIPSVPMLNRLSPVWSSKGDAIWYLHSTNYVGFSGYNDVAVNWILDNGSLDTSLLQSSSWQGGGRYDDIALSPDGNNLALSRGSKIELYEVLDKFQLKLLKTLNGGSAYFNLSWSPDSKKILYHTFVWPSDSEVFLYNLEFNTIKKMPNNVSFEQISWAYSSDRIAFKNADDIFMVNADGTNLINLTNTPGIEEQSPAFSPVEDKMIYAIIDSLDQVILLDLTSGSKEVIIADLEELSLFNNDSDNDTFTWSKDGSEFLFRYAKSNSSGLRRFNFDRNKIETIYVGSIGSFDWYQAP